MLKPEHIRALRHNGFPPEMVLVSFDATTIQRGVHYFETGHVIELNSDFPSLSEVSLASVVLGNSQYTTQVHIDLNSHKINSTCSCPLGKQCKHALASLLYYVRDQLSPSSSPHKTIVEKTTAPSAIQLWLADLNTPSAQHNPTETETPAQTHKTHHETSPRAELIYLLNQSNKRQAKVQITPRKANRLKKGGFGQGYPIQLDELFYAWKHHTFAYTADDEDIARLLLPPTSPYLSNNIRQLYLTGRLGLMTLDLLLQTERAYWQKTDFAPLKRGEPRQAEFIWTDDSNSGAQQIRLKTLPPSQDYFWLDKLFYVDQLRGECGELEHTPLSAPQVIKLLSAPPIPKTEAETVSLRLLEILPETDIPLPEARLTPETIDILGEDPVVKLLLHAPDASQSESSESGHCQHYASLSFIYETHELRLAHEQAIVIQTLEGKRYRIHRDLAAERDAVDILQDYGFTAQNANAPLDLHISTNNAALRALHWNHFIEQGIPTLREQGWQIDYCDSFQLAFSMVDHWQAELEQNGQDWLEISLGFMVDGKRINLLPILVDMLAQMHDPQALRQLLKSQEHLLIPLDEAENHWIKLESSRIARILDTLIELYDHESLNANGHLLLRRFQGTTLSDLLNDPALHWKGAAELKRLTQQLENFQGISRVTPPVGLQAELRPYQSEGLNWLQFLREYRFNGILADDMGLGKTLQTLAHLLLEKQAGRAKRPSLVLAPTSLMSNWRREAEKFAPELTVLTLHGTERREAFEDVNQHDIILTTYPLILRDGDFYKDFQFYYLVLDEAQAIKNAKAKTTQAIYNLQAEHRLCLTGTPMENHLGELWSMFHFLMPGFLGAQDRFNRLFRTPIEKQGDTDRQQSLRRRLQPFMLRRTKELVARELPTKTEMIRIVPLEGAQRDLYETVRLAMDKKVREEIRSKGFNRSHIMILDALLKLRQVCCDPRLLKLEKAKAIKTSAKLEMLMEMLPAMLDEGRKVLLFSQFTSMLALIEQALEKHSIRYSKLTGQTHDRESAINAFQEGDAQVFLISLKAGGTGLNLTAADTVIHYDPWWNPAVEHQATDRAYRIGQDKPVFVYKLLTEDTVEEKILKLQARKQALSDALYEDRNQETPTFSQDELLNLLKPLDMA
ncbi:MAG: hypothetical protein CR991_10040 [Proteobacteria bacterium]|nr:MAG: hypothetical protein CR991_10040 [Pseudomonadota bacterium]